jgi:glyoxylase-like metal-dependent hydrolase (beta-lactamase superfamily II)
MRVSARCFAITGLGYARPWSVNAGFIVGAHTTLIVDTGANALAAASIHGYATAARPGNRLVVLNTEKHFDHIGGNSYFRDVGVDVYGHPGIERTEAEFRAEIQEFNALTSNAIRRKRGEAEAFYHGTRLCNANLRVQDETAWDLGGCTVEILPAPGHTPTNLSVYVPGDGVLYSGDYLVNGYLPNLDAGAPSDWRLWLEPVDRIAACDPQAVVGGHGPVTTGDEESVRGYLLESIARGSSPAAG